MEKIANSYIKIDREFMHISQEYGNDIITHPLLTHAIDELLPFEEKFQANIIQSQLNLKGLTKDKKKYRTELTNVVFPTLVCFKQHGININDHDLQAEASISISKMNKLNQSKFIGICQLCIKLCQKYSSDWNKIGITEATVEDIKTRIESYETSIEKAAKARVDKSIANDKLEQLCDDNNFLIKNKIMPLVNAAFSKTKPEIVLAFENAMNMNKVHRYKRALAGQIIDDDTQEPILYATIQIKEIDLKRRIRSKAGVFYLQNLQPGSHTIICSHDEYETVEVTFIHAWGKTTKMEIRMSRKQGANAAKETTKEAVED